MPERTLPRLFEESVKAYPGNVLIWEKAGERYAPTSYAQLHDLRGQGHRPSPESDHHRPARRGRLRN